MLQRNVHKRAASLGEDVVAVDDLTRDVDAPPMFVVDSRPDQEFGVDWHRTPEVHEQPPGDGGEAIPARQQAAGLVQRRGDEASVDEARRRLVTIAELEIGLVLGQALLLGSHQMDPVGVVPAAPARGVVVRRHPGRLAQRSPPRSWWARKNSCEPAGAVAAEAEIASARVAAATICAER